MGFYNIPKNEGSAKLETALQPIVEDINTRIGTLPAPAVLYRHNVTFSFTQVSAPDTSLINVNFLSLSATPVTTVQELTNQLTQPGIDNFLIYATGWVHDGASSGVIAVCFVTNGANPTYTFEAIDTSNFTTTSLIVPFTEMTKIAIDDSVTTI
jgi:hypothetical protein